MIQRSILPRNNFWGCYMECIREQISAKSSPYSRYKQRKEPWAHFKITDSGVIEFSCCHVDDMDGWRMDGWKLQSVQTQCRLGFVSIACLPATGLEVAIYCCNTEHAFESE
eukprot:83618_1